MTEKYDFPVTYFSMVKGRKLKDVDRSKPVKVNAGASLSATQSGTPKISSKLMAEYKAEIATIKAKKSARRSKAIKSVLQAEGKG